MHIVVSMSCDAGHEVPVLARIAQRVTALVSSAGACAKRRRKRLQDGSTPLSFLSGFGHIVSPETICNIANTKQQLAQAALSTEEII